MAQQSPNVLGHSRSNISSPMVSIAFQNYDILSPSLMLPLDAFFRCEISSSEADCKSDSSLDLPYRAANASNTLTHNISLSHEFFDFTMLLS